MSGLGPHARELIDTASRYEALPSDERMARVRSAVLGRAVLGGVALSVGSIGLWAKGTAWAASGIGSIVTSAVIGAVAGGAVLHFASTDVARPPSTVMSAPAPGHAPARVTTVRGASAAEVQPRSEATAPI